MLVILTGILVSASFALLYFNTKAILGITTSDAPVAQDSNPSIFASLLKPIFFEPKKLSISKIGLKEAPVVEVGVDKDGRLETPKNYNEVGWYKNGPKAGEEGNAILAGHYDRVGGSPAVFYKLVKLEPGDLIEVEDSTQRLIKFEIYEVSYVSMNDPGAVLKAYEETKDPILTVITCGGVWSPVEKDYSKRLLIKAKKL